MIKRKLQLWAIVLIGSILLTSFPFAVFAQDSTESNVPTPEELGFEFDVENKKIAKYTGNETEISIPSKFNIDGQIVPVESIGRMAFVGNEAITKATIPGSIKIIEDSAFRFCSKLQELTLQKGLVEIRKNAFSNTEISKVHIPSSVKIIGKEAFSDCMNLEEVTLDEGLEVISEGAFRKTGIKEITIPSTVEKIGKNIFYMNKVIEKITILNNKENIDIAEKAFPKEAEVIYKEDEQPEEEENVVPDPVLRKIINNILKKEDLNAPITKKEMAGITTIYPTWLDNDELWQLKSLEGLQYAENLNSLQLSGVNVTDLSPLENLTHLTNLHFFGDYKGDNPDLKGQKSALKDITSIGKMEQLSYLRIIGTQLEDITPISNLKKLEKLHLQNNEISDISSLKDVPISSQLFLSGNCIADFSPLKDKRAFKSSRSGEQRVSITPTDIEFDNPLKDRGGDYIILPENDYIENTGDIGEKLKIIKAPETGDIIEIKLGTSYNADTLFVDISNIRDKIEDVDLEKHKVHIDVYGKQGNTMIGTIYNPNVQIWNDKNQELINDNNLSYIWELPDGKYTYKVSHPDYKDAEGEFEVKGEATKVEVPLSYDLEKPGNYAYPIIESLEILDRATKRVLGKGTFDGQIISVVIEDPKDRELVYNGRAMIKADTKNALSYECNTEASPSSTKFTETDGSIDYLNGKYSSVCHPFKKDSLTYMMLKGKGGLENHYGIVIKEKEKQHAVIFNTSADKSGTSLGSLRIPTGNFEGREFWEVFRFVQLVDHGEKAIEPLKYIKDTYDKVAQLYHKGGAFEGWYYKKDWVQKFDFDKPIEKDVEIHAKFSNSSNINEFPDPFTVRFVGPERDGINEGKKTYARLYYNKNGEWVERYHGSDPVKVQKVGDELRFKIDIIDEEYDLGYLCAMYNGRKLPITQHKDGSFSFVPGPSQDSSIFNKNIVYYDIIKKEYQKNSFDVNKQHNIHLLSEGSPLGPTLVLENMSSPYNSFNIAQEGNTVLLRVGGYKIEDVFVKSDSGKNINLVKVKDEEITEKGYKNQYYKFTMPSEDVDIIARGEGVAPTVDRLLTFKVKDENGNEIDPSKVEKLVVSTDPYEYIIEDITQPTEIASNASGRGYNYMLSIKGKGDFYGRFHLDKDSPDEVVLTIDMSEEIKKTKEDVQRLVDVAKGILKEKDKYNTKSIENLETAIENAEQSIKLQSGYNKAFFELTNAIDGLEKLEDPEPKPEVDKTKLKEAIDKAEKIETEGKTEESIKDLNNAIAKGKEILKKKEATQEEVNNAVKEIEVAISNLKDKEEPEPEIDRTKLEEVINRAKKVELEDKTEESVQTLENAILKGKEILGKEKVTQEEIDSAVRAIEAAMNNLEDKEEPKPEVDKTKLKEIINKAEKINVKGKTEESIKDLNNAIAKGKEILESEKATQEEINNAVISIEDAIKNLKDEEKLAKPRKPKTINKPKNDIAKPNIQNKPTKTSLPKTGQSSMIWLSILGATLLAMGILINKKKQKEI